MPETIVNTSPFQYLFQLGLLDVLPKLYWSVVVPDAVRAELAQGQQRGVALPDLTTLPWVAVRHVSHPGLLPLAADLGPGESEVLALGVEMPGSLVVLDDGLARRYAHALGLRLTGTLGVLLRAKRDGLLPEIAPILRQLDSLRFRLDPDTRGAVLRLAGE
jgi:uncharacterized protein